MHGYRMELNNTRCGCLLEIRKLGFLQKQYETGMMVDMYGMNQKIEEGGKKLNKKKMYTWPQQWPWSMIYEYPCV